MFINSCFAHVDLSTFVNRALLVVGTSAEVEGYAPVVQLCWMGIISALLPPSYSGKLR